MEASTPKRYLVVAHITAATPALIDTVSSRAEQENCEFVLLVPDVPDRSSAEPTLELALPLLEHAAGSPVKGSGGESDDPLIAIAASDSIRPPQFVNRCTTAETPTRVDVPPRFVKPWKRFHGPARGGGGETA
jgi:hypothetical protein